MTKTLSALLTAMVVFAAVCRASRAADPPTTLPEPSKLPTLWLIGDSTVRNGQDTGTLSQWGWGRPIAAFFDKSKINVQNRALGGTTSRSFQTKGNWGRVLDALQPGDFVIMQFGTNDGGAINDATRARGSLHGNGEETQEIDNLLTKQHEVVHTYGWYIRKYISDTRAKGGFPIVCSPIPRNIWADGKTERNVNYNLWASQAAEQVKAPFINLNEIIASKYDAMGQEQVTKQFFIFPEHTHPTWDGAVLNARCVVEGIKGLKDCDLANDLLPNPPDKLPPPTTRPK